MNYQLLVVLLPLISGFSILDFSHETMKPVDEGLDQWLSPSIQMKRELKPEEHEKP